MVEGIVEEILASPNDDGDCMEVTPLSFGPAAPLTRTDVSCCD